MAILNPMKMTGLFVAILMAMPTSAAPVVIYDAGEQQTQPMDTYLQVLRKPAHFELPDDPNARAQIQHELRERARKYGGSGSVRLPIRTTALTPLRIESRDAYFPNLMIPLFIVGADPMSLTWLKQWRSALLKVGAIGWVVQADNAQDLQAIAEAGAGLRFMAMPGDALNRIFGVKGYPVLISERAIEQ